MHTQFLIVCTFLLSALHSYGMSSFLRQAKNRAHATAQKIRSKVSDYKPKTNPVRKTIESHQSSIMRTQVKAFNESSPEHRMGRVIVKSIVFNALTQSALWSYNILTLTVLPLPLSILLGSAITSAPALIVDAAEILKRHWNYLKLKRAHNNKELLILQKLLDRVTLKSFSEKEHLLITKMDVPEMLVNKPLLPNNETILQSALRKGPHPQEQMAKDIFLINIKTLIHAGADPNPSVPDEAHPINIFLSKSAPDLETLALFVNPMIVPADTLRPLPQSIEQKIKTFVETAKKYIADQGNTGFKTETELLDSIEKMLETRKQLLWEREISLKKESHLISPIDL